MPNSKKPYNVARTKCAVKITIGWNYPPWPPAYMRNKPIQWFILFSFGEGMLLFGGKYFLRLQIQVVSDIFPHLPYRASLGVHGRTFNAPKSFLWTPQIYTNLYFTPTPTPPPKYPPAFPHPASGRVPGDGGNWCAPFYPILLVLYRKIAPINVG